LITKPRTWRGKKRGGEKMTLKISVIRQRHVDDRIVERAFLSPEEFLREAERNLEKRARKGKLSLTFAPYDGAKVIVGDGALTVTIDNEKYYLVGEADEVSHETWELKIRTVLSGEMSPRAQRKESSQIKFEFVELDL
jgi:hypothetical protein